jgi:acetoacetyl-CoA synthetase
MSAPVWQPQNSKSTLMAQFMGYINKKYQQNFNNYQQIHSWSIKEPALFWSSIVDFFKLKFDTPPIKILNNFDHMIDAKWFEGAYFNFAENFCRRKVKKMRLCK